VVARRPQQARDVTEARFIKMGLTQLRLYTVQPRTALEQIRTFGVFRAEPMFMSAPRDEVDWRMFVAQRTIWDRVFNVA
jgi:hypothetical protein